MMQGGGGGGAVGGGGGGGGGWPEFSGKIAGDFYFCPSRFARCTGIPPTVVIRTRSTRECNECNGPYNGVTVKYSAR